MVRFNSRRPYDSRRRMGLVILCGAWFVETLNDVQTLVWGPGKSWVTFRAPPYFFLASVLCGPGVLCSVR